MRVDFEFAALSDACGIVPACVNAILTGVLKPTCPADDKIAVLINCYRWIDLVPSGEAVDLKLTTLSGT